MSWYGFLRLMKKTIKKILSALFLRKTTFSSREKDLRVGAKKFAEQLGPAMKKLSQE